MAHNINYHKQRGHSFVSRKEKPWHGLGKIVDKAMTSAEAIQLANADYEVIKAPVWANFPQEHRKTIEGKYIKGYPVPDAYATFRTDTLDVFNIVGKRYEVVQNIEAFNFIDDIIKTGEAVIETAGVLGKGERVFVTAKLPNYIKLDNNDPIEGYLFITNSHDGTDTIRAAITKIRIVCNNTLNFALRNCTNSISLRHTKNVHDRLGEGLRLMKLYNEFDKEFQETLDYLKQKPVNDERRKQIIYDLFLTGAELKLTEMNNWSLAGIDEISTRKKNTISQVLGTIEIGQGQDFYRGSALHLFNGFTCYLGNVKKFNSQESKLDNILQGQGSQLRQQLVNNLIKL